MLSIASVLQKSSYDVSVLDAFLEGYSNDELVEKIIDINPDFVGFYVLTANGSDIFRICKHLKQIRSEIKIVLGKYAIGSSEHFWREWRSEFS